LTACSLVVAPLLPAPAQAAAPGFDSVALLLARHCTLCHQGPQAPLGLRLDSLAGVLAGSSRGPVVRSGDAAGSELIRRLKGQSQPRMPMTGPPYLSDAEVARFEAWIAAGLSPGDASASTRPPRDAMPPPLAVAPAVSGAPATPASSSVSTTPADRPGAAARAGGVPTWREVAPIFATRCAKCHTERGQMGPAPEGVLLDSYEGVLSWTDRVRVVPGRAVASELVRRIRGQSLPRMPFDGPPYLSDAEITLITSWIDAGARDSTGRPAPMPAGARIRLRGVLSVDGTLDGLDLPPASGGGGGGRRDRAPQPGARVELRGTVQADGSIAVERLRER
jgi:mono/diheme cytochrome c family protein